MIGQYATALKVLDNGFAETVSPESSINEEQIIYSLLVSYKFKILLKKT